MLDDPIDFVTIALSRISMHYNDKTKFRAWLTALIDLFLDLQIVALKIPETYDIDMATGVDLDMIGDILGFSRNFSLPLDLSGDLFSFDEENMPPTEGKGFSEEGDDSYGGYWLEENGGGSTVTKLPDDLYRLFLKAKTLTNQTHCTLEEIIEVFRTIFPGKEFHLTKISPMNLTISIHKSDYDENILKILENTDIIPRGAGVSLTFIDL